MISPALTPSSRVPWKRWDLRPAAFHHHHLLLLHLLLHHLLLSVNHSLVRSISRQGIRKLISFIFSLICIGIYIDFHVFIFSQVSVFLKQTIESLQIIIFEKILVESSFLMLIKYNFSSWNGIFKILNFLCYFETFTPLNYTGCRYWHIACRRS